MDPGLLRMVEFCHKIFRELFVCVHCHSLLFFQRTRRQLDNRVPGLFHPCSKRGTVPFHRNNTTSEDWSHVPQGGRSVLVSDLLESDCDKKSTQVEFSRFSETSSFDQLKFDTTFHKFPESPTFNQNLGEIWSYTLLSFFSFFCALLKGKQAGLRQSLVVCSGPSGCGIPDLGSGFLVNSSTH